MRRREFITLVAARRRPKLGRLPRWRNSRPNSLGSDSWSERGRQCSRMRRGLSRRIARAWLSRGPPSRHRIPLGRGTSTNGCRTLFSELVPAALTWSVSRDAGCPCRQTGYGNNPDRDGDERRCRSVGTGGQPRAAGRERDRTNVLQSELAAKRFELLKEILPRPDRSGTSIESSKSLSTSQSSRPSSSLPRPSGWSSIHGVRAPAEFESAFAAMAAKRVGAVVVIDDATLIANAPALARFALQQRLPSSGWGPITPSPVASSAMGVSFPDLFGRAATFVDKILKGAKPADLPVERAATIRNHRQSQNRKGARPGHGDLIFCAPTR